MSTLTYSRFFAITLFFFTLVGITSCSGTDDTVYDETQQDGPMLPSVDYDEFSKELKELEAKIASSASIPDEALLKEATTKFQDFAGYFPEDPKAPDYLLQASDYALLLGQVEKSVKILTRIMNEYPDYHQMESVMYNRASHMDFELRDTTNAKIAYQEFIDRFPTSDFVDDAQSRIKYISYSLEELPALFEKNLETNPQ